MPDTDTTDPFNTDAFKRDTPAATLRAVAAAFILGFEALPPGREFRYEGQDFVFSLRRTETPH